jgi:hypothetical protein
MGKWTNEVVLDPIEFDGDIITFTAKRLLAEDMALILQNYDKEKEVLRFANEAEMSKMTAAIFPKYVTKIEGMTKGGGEQFTVTEFVEASKEFYFVPLVGKLFSGIMKISTVGGLQAKNSTSPAPVPLEGSGEQSLATSAEQSSANG